MSLAAPNRPDVSSGRASIAIVASLYNETYVNAMLEAARGELAELMPSAQGHGLPGARRL